MQYSTSYARDSLIQFNSPRFPRPLTKRDRTDEAVDRIHQKLQAVFERVGGDTPIPLRSLRCRRREILLCVTRHPDVYGIRQGTGRLCHRSTLYLYLLAHPVPPELAAVTAPIDTARIPLGLL
jgi:hypothetical protein